MPAENIIFIISFIGFSTYQESITASSGEIAIQRVLLADNAEDLGGLLVEADREIAIGEAGIRKILQADISRVPTAGSDGDLASYLGTLPGVISTGDRGESSIFAEENLRKTEVTSRHTHYKTVSHF